jgi:hypothetical protein
MWATNILALVNAITAITKCNIEPSLRSARWTTNSNCLPVSGVFRRHAKTVSSDLLGIFWDHCDSNDTPRSRLPSAPVVRFCRIPIRQVILVGRKLSLCRFFSQRNHVGHSPSTLKIDKYALLHLCSRAYATTRAATRKISNAAAVIRERNLVNWDANPPAPKHGHCDECRSLSFIHHTKCYHLKCWGWFNITHRARVG